MICCCSTFSEYVSRAGLDDFAILAKRSGDHRFFVVQFRACAPEQERLFQNVPREIDIPQPLHLASQFGIQFCPFCGFDLSVYIENNKAVFDEFAQKHREFVFGV